MSAAATALLLVSVLFSPSHQQTPADAYQIQTVDTATWTPGTTYTVRLNECSSLAHY